MAQKLFKSIAFTVIFFAVCLAVGAAAGFSLMALDAVSNWLSLAVIVALAAACTVWAKGE